MWTRVQAAFALAHEVGHCQLSPGSDHNIARSTAWGFEKEIRPLAQEYDAQHSDGRYQNFVESHDERLRQERIAWEAKGRDRLEKLKTMLNEAGEQISKVDPAFTISPPFSFKRLSHEAQLDWILKDDSGIGEEVLCDHVALTFTVGLMDDSVLPFEECLSACVMAVYELGLLRCAEILCRAHTSSAMRRDALHQLLQELDARQKFLGLCVQLLHQKRLLQELDASHNAQQQAAFLEKRSAAFAEHLNRFAHVFDTRLLTMLLEEEPGTMEATKRHVASDDVFQGCLRSPSLPRIVADMTCIGPPSA
jgi:hypothetical protein